MFAVTVFNYAVSIYNLQKLPEPAFDQLPASFLHCLTYSLSVITTATISNVSPKTDTAYFIYGFELVSTFLILSLFFSLFSAAMSHTAEERIRELDELMKKVLLYFDEKRKSLQSEVIDLIPNPRPQESPKAKEVPTLPPPHANDRSSDLID
jgi:hypothetical protein